MNEQLNAGLGRVALEPPGPVIAGSVGQWALTYTVGSYGVDEGGTIMLLQRTACDWEPLQFDRPTESGYTTVTTNGNATLNPRFEKKRHGRPWQSWCLVIDVRGGYLSPGERVTIVLGDQARGAPGIRAQTFVESQHEFQIHGGSHRRSGGSPTTVLTDVSVKPGDPTRLVCIAPTEMVVGHAREVFIKSEDAWGNPAAVPEAVSLELNGEADTTVDGTYITAKTPGRFVVRATASGLSCESNPVVVLAKEPQHAKFWGDLHAQTESTVGTGTDEEYFIFARDVARLDFASHQGNDFQVTDENWKRLAETIKTFYEPGGFVVFPGYEWSGNTSAGGDHNVIYLKDDQPIYRSSHWQIPEVPEDERSPAHPITELYRRLHKNQNALLIPHVGGRFADTRRFFDQQLISVVEIVSCWGVFEWMLWDALDQGYMVGVVCNSDGHKGRPGAEGPGAGTFGIYGGLTCVLAESLTRDAVFRAIRDRRCYGTTGTRIYLDFQADGHTMGEEFNGGESVEIRAGVIGTGAMEALHLYEGKQIIHTVRPDAFSEPESSRRVRISWEGAHMRGRARRATWDGTVSVAGNHIESAETFAFDSPADGILEIGPRELTFKSSTTGDTDGIDLLLRTSRDGVLSFGSALGSCSVELAGLDMSQSFDFGGLGLRVTFQRYPESLVETQLSLAHTVTPRPGRRTPYYVKVIQEDGNMAWSSPVYVVR